MTESRQMTNRWIERIALRPELGRALRVALALGIPLAVCHALNRPVEAVFIAMTAQNLALYDLRGAYRVRLAILAVMTVVVAGSAMLGVFAGGTVAGAVAAMGLIAVFNGCWRHLSTDYGPSVAVSSTLFFLLGLAQPGNAEHGFHLAKLVAIGGATATLLQIGFWLIRPQHPLRYAVAETWVAASDLFAAMRIAISGDGDQITTREQELRAALDRTFLVLAAAKNRRQETLIAHLEEMRREVVHLVMRVSAFYTALEPLHNQPAFARTIPTVDSVLKTLSDAARSTAITLITHRAENFASSSVRLQRSRHLLRVLEEEMAGCPLDIETAQLRAALESVVQVIPQIQSALGETVDHGAVLRFNFPPSLPDLNTRSLQSLAAWLDPAPQFDPVLLRYSARMVVLTMLAVGLYKGFHIPRGYWIAFTIIVVMQPDFGSTRRRAGERAGGTFLGSLLASALLWIKMPLPLLDGLAVIMAFAFAFFLKSSYRVAIFFVTLMLVLITEMNAPVHFEFTISRLLSTLLGGGMALAAALFFWPSWEKEKFPVLLSAAIRANRAYLESMRSWLGVAGGDESDPLLAKRRAENANRFAAASLQRMQSEPAAQKQDVARAAALTAYNQRLTRALTALAVQLQQGVQKIEPGMPATFQKMAKSLDALAQAIEPGAENSIPGKLAAEIDALDRIIAAPCNAATLENGRDAAPTQSDLIWTQIGKSIAEIKAMVLALG